MTRIDAMVHRSVHRTLHPIVLLGLAGAALLMSAGCGNPRAEANTAQALNDAANDINGLKNDVAQLQTQLDSLQITVTKQDSLITRIMAVNNIPR
jgi:peptidoglycan hydrolase CwlO-like protein